MTVLENKITSFLPLHTFLYYLLLSLLLCKFFKVPAKEKPLLAFKCVYVCLCVCVCVMKKCQDETAGLDTTVVLQGNKPFSLELSITLDRKYDPCEWDSVGQVWNLFSCEVFVGIGYKCKANYHPLTTCCHAIV